MPSVGRARASLGTTWGPHLPWDLTGGPVFRALLTDPWGSWPSTSERPRREPRVAHTQGWIPTHGYVSRAVFRGLREWARGELNHLTRCLEPPETLGCSAQPRKHGGVERHWEVRRDAETPLSGTCPTQRSRVFGRDGTLVGVVAIRTANLQPGVRQGWACTRRYVPRRRTESEASMHCRPAPA